MSEKKGQWVDVPKGLTLSLLLATFASGTAGAAIANSGTDVIDGTGSDVIDGTGGNVIDGTGWLMS